MCHLWSLLCKTLSICLLMILSFQTLSLELTDLYQAEVDANQSQSQWQQAAVAAVLVKLTGSTQILEQQSIKTAIRSSSDFIKQYQMVQRDGRNFLQVSLDQQKITSLLQQLQIPIWGSRRPDVLVWLTEKTLEEPQLVVLAAHPLRSALHEQAKTYGLSYVFPRYDEQDLALVNAVALWSGDWTGLTQASLRYQPNQVFNLLMEQQVDMTGQLQYRLTSQYWLDGMLQSQEFTGPEVSAVLLQFSQQLAATQAAQYAVNVQTSAVSDASIVFTLDGVESLTDVVTVQKLFSSMLSVRQQQLEAFQPGTAQIRLTLAASAQDFYRALALEKQLQPVMNPQPDTALSSETNLTTTEPQSGATDVGIPTDAVTLKPESTQEATLSDAELALEAALSDGPAAQVSDDATAESIGTQGVPPAEVVIPVGHSHFRFIRP